MMSHEQALQTQASMKYALGELSPDDRDSFEEHFADCAECMREVETSAVLAANAREVFRERAAAKQRVKGFAWFGWRPFPVLAFSTALNLVLLAGLGYEFGRVHKVRPLSVPAAEVPQGVDIVPVRGATRGAGAMQVVRVSSRPIVLEFDLPQPFGVYRYSIERAGTPVMSGAVTLPNQAESLNLEIPADHFTPGEYRVTVTANNGDSRENLGACLLEVETK